MIKQKSKRSLRETIPRQGRGYRCVKLGLEVCGSCWLQTEVASGRKEHAKKLEVLVRRTFGMGKRKRDSDTNPNEEQIDIFVT